MSGLALEIITDKIKQYEGRISGHQQEMTDLKRQMGSHVECIAELRGWVAELNAAADQLRAA